PWNNPLRDIARKLQVLPKQFLVGIIDSSLIPSVMEGYEGHRGWINYLAVHPEFQVNGLSQNQFADSYGKRYDSIFLPKTWFYQRSCSQYGKTAGSRSFLK
ncbi:MAG: hypothetical protein L7T82_06050, partial [SAR324 cluster bacterium]|nr:hypothetical protein [SAR324 cluster bacterium]